MSSNELSSKSIEKLNRQIATINQWPEAEVNDFLEDHPEKAFELVLTLKHYANPLGGYPHGYLEIERHLKNITDTLDDPAKLQPGLKLNKDESVYLTDLMRLKLDQLAQDIIVKNNFTQEQIDSAVMIAPQPSAPPLTEEELNEIYNPKPSAPPLEDENPEIENSSSKPNKKTKEEIEKDSVDNWWNNLTLQQQKQVKKRFKNLNDEQKNYLKERTYYFYHYYPEKNEYFYYRQMCLIDAELNYLALRTVFDLSALALITFAYSAASAVRVGVAVANHLGGMRHASRLASNTSKNDGNGLLLLVGAAFIAAGVIAVGGAIYAAKKLFNSVRNIFNGHKILRSLYRLAGTGGGVYLGLYGGAILGAMIGSAVPGLGTAVGATLGAIIGIGIGAAFGSLLAKYTAKLISAIFYRNEINPTNPDKWRLSKNEKILLNAKGISVVAVNHEMMRVRDEKKKIGISGSFFWTDARKEKNRLNKELKSIKKGEGFSVIQSKPYHPPYTGLLFKPAPIPSINTDYKRTRSMRK